MTVMYPSAFTLVSCLTSPSLLSVLAVISLCTHTNSSRQLHVLCDVTKISSTWLRQRHASRDKSVQAFPRFSYCEWQKLGVEAWQRGYHLQHSTQSPLHKSTQSPPPSISLTGIPPGWPSEILGCWWKSEKSKEFNNAIAEPLFSIPLENVRDSYLCVAHPFTSMLRH